jgi:hypothetical protein
VRSCQGRSQVKSCNMLHGICHATALDHGGREFT